MRNARQWRAQYREAAQDFAGAADDLSRLPKAQRTPEMEARIERLRRRAEGDPRR